jgi:hypothetical protein
MAEGVSNSTEACRYWIDISAGTDSSMPISPGTNTGRGSGCAGGTATGGRLRAPATHCLALRSFGALSI